MEFDVAGIDFPGDSTQPCKDMAAWIAISNHATSVSISHFLTAMFVFCHETLCKYWPSVELCEAYLQRERIDLPLDEIKSAFAQWFLDSRERATHIPSTTFFVTFRKKRDEIPRASKELENLLNEVHKRASEKGLEYPSIEYVLASLLLNHDYGEQDRLRESKISVEVLLDAVK